MSRAARALAAAALALVAAAAPALAQDFPEFSAPLVDDAGIVPDDAEERINAELLAYQRRSSNQIAVLVIDTYGDASLEDYSEDLFDAWGVGDKDEDNGVLVVIAMQERDIRIEVGYGVEGDLTDLEAGRIIRNRMAPLMREGDVAGAITVAANDIRSQLGDEEAEAVDLGEEPEPEIEPSLSVTLVSLAIFIWIIVRLIRRRRGGFWSSPIFWGGGWGGGTSGGGFGGGGGGFGGGGGGGSGGGGASGGW